MFRNWQFLELREANDPGGAGGDPIPTPGPDPEVDPYAGLNVVDFIPDEFKGRDPAEVKLLLSQMPRIVKNQKDDLDTLRLQMAGAGAPTVTHGAPAAPAEPVKTAEEKQAEFEALFDKDPRAAISQFIAEEYAPTLGSISSRLDAGDLARVRATMPNFNEYEEDVTDLLTRSGSPATEQNIRGAYAMAVGNRQIEKDALLARAADNPIPATPAPEGDKVPVELTPLEDEVRQQMGLSPEDYVKYGKEDPMELKIRT